MRSIFLTKQAAVVLFLCISGGCYASEMIQPPVASREADIRVLPANKVDVVPPVADLGTPLESAEFSDLRGGFDLVKNDMKLNGTVSNNSAVDVITGSNYIANGSFSNSSGFPMVVQNSGSNVLIQNATIINLQYK